MIKYLNFKWNRNEKFKRATEPFSRKDVAEAKIRKTAHFLNSRSFLLITLISLFIITFVSVIVPSEGKVSLTYTVAVFALLSISMSAIFLTYNLIRIAQNNDFYNRFEIAINHVNSDRIETRRTGILLMENIMNTSDRDERRITLQFLTAFVRKRTSKENSLKQGSVVQALEHRDEGVLIAEDVQLALTVIGRRKFVERDDRETIDLSNSNLRGTDFYRADLRHINFENTDLVKSILVSTNLTGANLRKANLASCIAMGAIFEFTVLEDTNFEDARLDNAIFKNITNASRANFERASLRNADFEQIFALLGSIRVTNANLEDIKPMGPLNDKSKDRLIEVGAKV